MFSDAALRWSLEGRVLGRQVHPRTKEEVSVCVTQCGKSLKLALPSFQMPQMLQIFTPISESGAEREGERRCRFAKLAEIGAMSARLTSKRTLFPRCNPPSFFLARLRLLPHFESLMLSRLAISSPVRTKLTLLVPMSGVKTCCGKICCPGGSFNWECALLHCLLLPPPSDTISSSVGLPSISFLVSSVCRISWRLTLPSAAILSKRELTMESRNTTDV